MSKLRAFTMPKWGIEMQEGTIGEWNVREGDSVRKGQPIAQIETDKVVNEVVSDFDTTIVRIVGAVGDTYPVGALLAVTATAPASADEVSEFVRSFRSAAGAEPPAEEAAPDDGPEPAAVPPDPSSPPGTSRANEPAAVVRARAVERSPAISAAAREYAAARSMDVTKIRGSGRTGRITLQTSIRQPSRRPPRESPALSPLRP